MEENWVNPLTGYPSARRIFDVVFAHQIPDCWLAWASDRLRKRLWHLRVIPFRDPEIDCKIVETERWGVKRYECGYEGRGDPAYRGRCLKKGSHENLHPIIHLLRDVGVKPEAIRIEEKFRGCVVDVLAEMGDSYIIVELGSLTNIGRFCLADEDCVKAFWFGDCILDNEKGFIYSLSKKEVWTESGRIADVNDYYHFIAEYLKNKCGRRDSTCDTYGALDCRDHVKLLKSNQS